MPNWKKLLVSGSDASLNSLTVVNGITGSLFGTSSWAVSASNALTASSVNPLNQNVSINGALNVTGSFNVSGSTGNVFTANVDTIVFTGSLSQSGSVNVNGTITATSFTGSLFGTASQAVSSSYALSASYAVTASHSQRAISSSYALTASYAENITVSGSIIDVDYIDFDTTQSFTNATGRLGWDNGEGTLQLGLEGGNVQYSLGEQLYQYVYNAEATTLTKGQVVYISGSQGNTIAVKLASDSAEQGSANTLGLVAETIASGENGWVITEGTLRKLNTLGLTAGQLIFVGSTPGTYTQTPPTAPSHSVRLGYVERVDATVGSIYVKIDNGYELGELHNIIDTTTTSSYGDLLVKSGSVWINSFQLTGSYGLTGSLNATSFTGSLQGTASWAQNALTASNVNGYSTSGTNDYVPLWQPSGSLSRSIIYQKGNDTVGINRTNVTSTLDVLALSGNQIANFETQNFGDVYIQLKNNLGYGYIGVVNRDFYFQPGGSTKAILSASGEFGLGTFTPKYTLDVVGSGNLTNGLTATGSIKLPSLTNVNQLNIVGYDTTTGQLYYQSTSSLSITSASYAVSASYAQTASYAFAIPDQGYQFTQAVTSSTWTINHNLNTLTPLVDVYDSSYNQLIPAGIQSTTANTTIVTFSSAITGYAIVSKGSGINSETALTASLPLLGIITASAVNTTITFTKGNGTTFDVTVTQSGSVASASYADFAVTASYASTVGYNFEQLVGSTTWTVNHNLNNRHPLVQVYDSNHLVLIPQSISGSNVNTTIITFSTPMTGYARIV